VTSNGSDHYTRAAVGWRSPALKPGSRQPARLLAGAEMISVTFAPRGAGPGPGRPDTTLRVRRVGRQGLLQNPLLMPGQRIVQLQRGARPGTVRRCFVAG
jgi:hypothetical protein